MSLNASALAANEFSSCSRAGSSVFVASSSAARWTALGNTSLDDCPMFTWSFGCAPESVAITSLAFMFDDVPEPGLEHVDRELRVVLAVGDLVAGGGDLLGQFAVEQPELARSRARRCP